jgi:trimethylamine--corrinoid protein Co-methyltransferase
MLTTVLSEQQVSRIHQASLDILENIGVEIPHEDMLTRFADNGATVDTENKRVKIPPELVMRCVNQAGKQYTLYGRDLSQTAHFGQGQRNYNSIAGEALWIDQIGQERRYATLKDVATATRFADALEHINIPGAMSDPHELPINYRCVAVLAEMIRHTTKPVTLWLHDRSSAIYLVELLIAVRASGIEAQDFPLTYPFLEPISPLRFAFNGIDLLYETARLSLPVAIGPMAQMGLSAPATVAGTLAQENAEILAGICVVQLIKPGVPICYGGICHAFDMRTTQLIFSGPEQAIFGVAMTQMGKHYGFPVYINVGLTDAKRPDAQAGLEAGITLAFGAAAGADIFGHMGISGVDQASSLDMLVLQNEVISFVESTMREIDFGDDAFAIEEIADAGPGGTFIDRMHTATHFRKELWFPKLLDRDYYQAWLDKGAKSLEQKCAETKERILQTHEPEPIDDELAKLLDEIVGEAERELV